MTSINKTLAINGGEKLRKVEMPSRIAFGPSEEKMVQEVISYYREKKLDPGYQGHFEERYCQAFVNYMGGGYTDAVATGTLSVFVAIAALGLEKGSEVLVSPITDPGSLSAIIMNGLVPRLMDSSTGSYNIDARQFEARISKKTKAAVIVHSLGQACQEIAKIVEIAKQNNILIVEDCSQAHGAMVGEKKVGTFGDIAAFSTMFSKTHITGGTGGMVYTQSEELYRMSLAHADRGKPVWEKGYDPRNPSHFLFPALNLHTNEISCSIGLSSLGRLEETRYKRLQYVKGVHSGLSDFSKLCKGHTYTLGDSPFVYPVFITSENFSCSKLEFAKAVLAEGITLNPHYEYLVSDWPFLRGYLSDDFATPNARATRDGSFILYLNEKYGDQEINDSVKAICKVEEFYGVI